MVTPPSTYSVWSVFLFNSVAYLVVLDNVVWNYFSKINGNILAGYCSFNNSIVVLNRNVGRRLLLLLRICSAHLEILGFPMGGAY